MKGRPSPSPGLRIVEALAPLVLLLLFGVLYNEIGEVAAARGVDFGPAIVTALDERIPLVPIFFLPYSLFWIFPVLAFTYLYWKVGWDPGIYRRLFVSLWVLIVVCSALWIVFPVFVGLRAEEGELAGHGLLGNLISLTYIGASHWNACPSFHVAGTWFLYRALRLYVPGGAWIFLGVAILIFASTVLIRIHYLLDIPAGLLVSELAYRLMLRRLEAKKAFRDVPAGQAAAVAGITILLGVVSYGILLAV